MLAAADDELPEELAGPVGYADLWLWLAVVGIVLVLLYYLGVWLFTRPRRVRTGSMFGRMADVPNARRAHLAELDRIDAEVRAGTIEARDGHQQLSEVVRSYVETVSSLPARTMALVDFRAHAPAALADAIELMYPPEFAPDGPDHVAQERFDHALRDSRRLVASWS